MKNKTVTIADLQKAINQTQEKIRGIPASKINPRFRLSAIVRQNTRREPHSNKATV
jgi:hypothetical protein